MPRKLLEQIPRKTSQMWFETKGTSRETYVKGFKYMTDYGKWASYFANLLLAFHPLSYPLPHSCQRENGCRSTKEP